VSGHGLKCITISLLSIPRGELMISHVKNKMGVMPCDECYGGWSW